MLIAALAAPAGPAGARPGDGENFWASLVAPNAEAIDLVLAQARALRLAAMSQYGISYDPSYAYDEMQREERQRRLEDAYGMLRYARRELDPEQPEVLYELGRNADDIGRYDEALEVLETFVGLTEKKDRRVAEANIRIGRIRARYGEWDEAIASFKRSLASRSSVNHGVALLYLGSAHMHNGQLAEAIDVLSQAAELQPGTQYYLQQVAQFTLAVAYDRDEQISRSHEMLEKLLAVDPSLTYVLGYPSYNYGSPDSLDADPLFVPPHERQYFVALKYEASGFLELAREEWLAYTRAADAGPARDRARAHISDIDEMLDERLKATDNERAVPAARHKKSKRKPKSP